MLLVREKDNRSWSEPIINHSFDTGADKSSFAFDAEYERVGEEYQRR